MYRILILFVLAAGLTSCGPSVHGNGNVKSENRSVDNFHSLDVSGGFKVILSQTGEPSLKLETDENLHQYIESYVDGGVLYVSSTERIGRSKALNLYVNVDELRSIESSGASEIQTKGVLKTQKLSLDFSGAAEAHMNLVCQELKGDFSGAAELNLNGKASVVNFDASGAVEVNALEFETENFRLDISGAGEADIFVTKVLDINASGAVEVKYKGNPETINRDISGAADIKPI